MKSKIIAIKLGVMLLIFSTATALLAYRSNNRLISGISIDIHNPTYAKFINDSMVREILIPTGDYAHLRARQISIGGMEKQLKSNPYVADCQVSIDPKALLKAEVDQEKPIARIHTDKEKYYLSNNLIKLPLSPRHSAPVILVTGNIKEPDWEGLRQLIIQLKQRKLLINQAIAVEKESENAFKIHVKNGTFHIDFGGLNHIPEKLDKLEVFYREYLSEVGLNKYKKIVLKYSNQIVAEK